MLSTAVSGQPGWRADFARHPAFAPLARWTRALRGDDWPTLDTLNRLAAEGAVAGGRPLVFAPQQARQGQHVYETTIFASGVVPTRPRNWHDLLNALCWLEFPATKAALNAVHVAELAPGRDRSPRSDAATLFDESGLVLAGPHRALAEALADARWHEAFVARRADWTDMHAVVIGHALLEKLLAPWPGITAKCLFLEMPTAQAGLTDGLDRVVAAVWRGQAIRRPADLFAVPVLGIPGWCADNADPAYYRDTRHFRPRHR